jgi:ABC-type lipopolysaccharide export system ATPase subunit
MSTPSNEVKRLRRKATRKATRELINGYKENIGCVDCPFGTKHPCYVLDFDHLIAEQKIDNVSIMIKDEASIRRIFNEIKKCEVVCKNHHAIRTHKRRST